MKQVINKHVHDARDGERNVFFFINTPPTKKKKKTKGIFSLFSISLPFLSLFLLLPPTLRSFFSLCEVFFQRGGRHANDKHVEGNKRESNGTSVGTGGKGNTTVHLYNYAYFFFVIFTFWFFFFSFFFFSFLFFCFPPLLHTVLHFYGFSCLHLFSPPYVPRSSPLVK
uniref:Uncharacterized protein n=1 Tax=Trypanosoma vivax (strain Y486) TaxID=1055687 RepID=G0TR53_TRYVY|nr:conserved hypothetical protein, in T. vivax [Trypanosoma vivax Y486]